MVPFVKQLLHSNYPLAAGLMGLVLASDGVYARDEVSMPTLDVSKIYRVEPFRFQSSEIGLFVYFSKNDGFGNGVNPEPEYMGVYKLCDPELKRNVMHQDPNISLEDRFAKVKKALGEERPFIITEFKTTNAYIDQDLNGKAEETVKVTKNMRADTYMPRSCA